MNKLLALILTAVLLIPCLSHAGEPNPNALRMMTFNIRYNNPGDGVNAWPNRKDAVAEMIRDRYVADVAGLQEALIGQVKDLQARLPGYTWFGVGRDDGWDQGEFMAIFYRKDRLQLLQQNTFWLSTTPETPGVRSWDAACNRIVTWGKFQDRKTGSVFYHFNTHFDHKSQWARKESAKLLWKRIKAISGDTPAVLTGDFNVNEKNEVYSILTGKLEIDGEKSDLKDARYVSRSGHKGPTSTFTRENWTQYGPPESKIDFIFVRNGISVLSHRIPTDQFNGHYPSDHLPVVTELVVP